MKRTFKVTRVEFTVEDQLNRYIVSFFIEGDHQHYIIYSHGSSSFTGIYDNEPTSDVAKQLIINHIKEIVASIKKNNS